MALSATFGDAALGPQAVFRTLLDALARPGTIHGLCGDVPAPPPPAAPALYATALTLVDYETPVWLDPALAPLAEPLRFHTGAPLVSDPQRAAFALAADAAKLPPLAAFAAGTSEYPDRSTTLVVQVKGFGDGPWQLGGPGIRDRVRFGAHGLPADFRAQWEANGALFPRGVDLVLVAGHEVAGLPRTTRIEG